MRTLRAELTIPEEHVPKYKWVDQYGAYTTNTVTAGDGWSHIVFSEDDGTQGQHAGVPWIMIDEVGQTNTEEDGTHINGDRQRMRIPFGEQVRRRNISDGRAAERTVPELTIPPRRMPGVRRRC